MARTIKKSYKMFFLLFAILIGLFVLMTYVNNDKKEYFTNLKKKLADQTQQNSCNTCKVRNQS